MNQDLIGSEHRDTTIKWDGGNDTLKFFIQKQKELGGQWYYNNKKITYKYNTNGIVWVCLFVCNGKINYWLAKATRSCPT